MRNMVLILMTFLVYDEAVDLINDMMDSLEDKRGQDERSRIFFGEIICLAPQFIVP
ncbi:MAG: hypothetical protein U9N77_14585 [Thermodesulfobacteriota bacterium]|nr:hypothetical protein [Thermodesulfobacteriota bacterium]